MTRKELLMDFYSDFYFDDEKKKVMRKREKYNDLFRDIHGTDFLPDDFRYEIIHSLIDCILSYSFDESYPLPEACEDFSHEIIDGLIPVYNRERLDWLNSHMERAYYIDQARDNGLISEKTDEFDRIAAGIYEEISEIYYRLVNEVESYWQDFCQEEG